MPHPSIGADPEFFITSSKNGKIIESNKIIPTDGLSAYVNSKSKCTIDGVQAELNPAPRSCRQGACDEYMRIFNALVTTLSKKKANICLDSMIHLTQEELDSFSIESRTFGCAPSKNYYTGKESVISVNPSVYGYRSAGGHIHLSGGIGRLGTCIKENYKLLVRLLDLILGNTCVMIDRDPNQKERRRVYGRAGEYRLPPHGLEYRTLSNFWIRNYQLMSMVYGFARLAVCIGYNIYLDEQKTNEKSVYGELLEASNESNIEKAINNNDFDLAKENWDSIKSILVSMLPNGWFGYAPIDLEHIKPFEHFIRKGLDYWFKDVDILTYWTETLTEPYGVGWECFLDEVVEADIYNKGNILWSLGYPDDDDDDEGFIIEIIKK